MAYTSGPKVVSPIGTAGSFTKLSVPDDYNNELAYKVTLIVDPEETGAAAFIDTVKKAAEAEYERAQAELVESFKTLKGAQLAKARKASEELEVHTPMGEDYDDDGAPNGLVTFTMKRKAAGVYQKGRNAGKAWTQSIVLVDADKKPIPDTVDVSDGSQIRVQVEVNPFTSTGLKKSGVALKILAVQVVEVVSGFGGGGASAFDTVEGGYSAPAADSAEEDLPFEPPADDAEDCDDF